MKKLFIFCFIFAVYGLQGQTEIGGITLPGTIKADDHKLMLNGGGLREKFFLDMYVGGLYLKQKSSNAEAIMNADEPMAIKLHIISRLITADKMNDAVEEGFEKSTDGNKEKFRKKIDQFKEVFSQGIEKNHIYDIIYIPGSGTEIYANGKKVTTIEGYAFKKALFGIWFGEEPADEDLKAGMLGQ